MGRGLPPAWSKPDPVTIRLPAKKKTSCLNLKINTEFSQDIGKYPRTAAQLGYFINR